MNSHLSSGQFDDALAGRPAPETLLHIHDCARCAGEIASLSEAVGIFREAATGVAEHHRRFAVAASPRQVPRMAWGLAAAALFVSIAAPFAVHRHSTPVVAEKAPQLPATMSDDALLNSVRNDLSASVPESLLPLAGASTHATDAGDKSSTDTQRKNQ